MSGKRYVWIVAAGFVILVAFFAGRALGSNAGGGTSFAYDVATSPYAPAQTDSGVSKGGFSGFGAASGLDGETIVSGRVRAVGTDTVTLETAGGGTEVVRITGPGTLRRIESAPAPYLRPGMTVVVRSSDDGDTAAAVLVLAEP